LREHADGGGRVGRLLTEKFEHFVPLVEQGITQATTRRVLCEEQLPATEKILRASLRSTPRSSPATLGRRAQGVRAQGSNRRGGRWHRKPLRGPRRDRFGTLAASRESQGASRTLRKSAGASGGGSGPLLPAQRAIGSRVGGQTRRVLPKSGKLSKERKRHEKQRWFVRGLRFRAGVEGRISVLTRAFGLDVCLDHGEEGMGRWVGWGILTHNLRQIARTQAARQAA
jgi:IS5 family transposase